MIFVTTGKIKKLSFVVLKYTIFTDSKLFIANLLYGITEVIPLSVITLCYSIFLQYKFVAISMFITI